MTLHSLSTLGGGKCWGSRKDLSPGHVQYQILPQPPALSLGTGLWPRQTSKPRQDVVCPCPMVEEDRKNMDSKILSRNMSSWWQQESGRDITPAKTRKVQVTLSKSDTAGFLSNCALPTGHFIPCGVPETSGSLFTQGFCSLTLGFTWIEWVAPYYAPCPPPHHHTLIFAFEQWSNAWEL